MSLREPRRLCRVLVAYQAVRSLQAPLHAALAALDALPPEEAKRAVASIGANSNARLSPEGGSHSTVSRRGFCQWWGCQRMVGVMRCPGCNVAAYCSQAPHSSHRVLRLAHGLCYVPC